MKSAPLALLLSLILVFSAFSANYPEHARIKGPVLLTGLEDTAFPQNYQAPRSANFTLDDGTPGSVYYTVGTTYYDNQHNGTAGKQLAVDRRISSSRLDERLGGRVSQQTCQLSLLGSHNRGVYSEHGNTD